MKNARSIDYRIVREVIKWIDSLGANDVITTSLLFRTFKFQSYVLAVYLFDVLVERNIISDEGAIIRKREDEESN